MYAILQSTTNPDAEGPPVTDPEIGSNVREQDELRLLGLSRIPRCAGCSRFAALVRAHRTRIPISLPWPAAPRNCRYQVCAPLVRRLSTGTPSRRALCDLLD
jgi:hypothetical protein